MGFSLHNFSPKHTPKAALSPQLWREKTASRKFFDRTKIASKKSPAKPTTTREKSDRTYETATEVIYEHYRYTAFGEPEIYDSSGNKLATSAIKNEILWNSRRYDSATNLYYYKYRHYAPALGRWPSRDPIEEDGGVNLYGFVGNNPIYWWDSLGLNNVGDENVEQEMVQVVLPDNSRFIVKVKGKLIYTCKDIEVEGSAANTGTLKYFEEVFRLPSKKDTDSFEWNSKITEFSDPVIKIKSKFKEVVNTELNATDLTVENIPEKERIVKYYRWQVDLYFEIKEKTTINGLHNLLWTKIEGQNRYEPKYLVETLKVTPNTHNILIREYETSIFKCCESKVKPDDVKPENALPEGASSKD
jgi:RHS repeat-associated protein